MREIKFRAWDEKNQAMIYPKGILFDGRVVNFMCGMLEPFDGYKLMQYTGLKDRNGKEIYEGDVWLPLGCETPRVIVWHRYGWWFQYPGGGVTRPLEWTEDGEIIGNIYENPELLKGEETA